MEIPTFEESFKLIKRNFWLSGIPLENTKTTIRFFLLYISLLLIIIEETAFLVSKISSEDLLKLTELAPCTCIGVLSLLKFSTLCFKRQKIRQLTDMLEQLHDDISSDVNKKTLVKRDIIFVNKLIKYYTILNLILITVYNFSTLVFIGIHYTNTKEILYSLPYAVIVPFSTDMWPTWLLIYIHSITSGFICVLYFTTIDSLYCIMTSYICCNFIIINNEIRHLETMNPKTLINIVKKHQYTIKLSEDLEDIFTACNLFNVLIGSLEICALGFNLTTGDWAQIPGCILFLLSVLLQIFMMSFFGENILRESTKVGESAFFSKWYETDEISKKIILYIMTRSHAPQKLTAYKFSVIGYGSFIKIISTSWSYFTILKTVYTPSTEVQIE
uniref:Odorant receptor n=1 Tax=Streltzoviella insularis TaxID=1206366 RepID=A0A7D5UMN4_9NEOP|nr:odorant receptor 32 [Streltzoviella insularis]